MKIRFSKSGIFLVVAILALGGFVSVASIARTKCKVSEKSIAANAPLIRTIQDACEGSCDVPCFNSVVCTPCGQLCNTAFHECVSQSPIIIDVEGNGYDLTDAQNGIAFDLNGDGIKESMSWTSRESDDAWLALDRNGNGAIDNGTELFGSFSPQPFSLKPHGFIALTEYDKTANGGNGDMRIDQRDSIYSSLRLWQDKNHNGISEEKELHMLPEFNIAVIELNYEESNRVDKYGNEFRYRSRVLNARGKQDDRWCWDVFLLSLNKNGLSRK